MTTFAVRSGPSSGIPSVSDLDAYSLRDFQFPSVNYAPSQDEDFGFDPPDMKISPGAQYQTYSPPNDPSMSGWPEFTREDIKESTEPVMDLDGFEMDKFLNSSVPNSETVVSRFGQFTPPRSHSAASSKSEDKAVSPKTKHTERKKSKTQAKELESPAATTTTTTTSKAGRKRKSTRKSSIVSDKGEVEDESKRKHSLEKNRLAAAKCRINKKEKTEQLQRDSHEKAVQNAYLKEQIMRMKDEVQQMNAILLSHANCDGCKSPEGLRSHLSQLGNDFYHHQQMAAPAPSFVEYNPMHFADLSMMQEQFFHHPAQSSMLHPPLPDFGPTAEFEVDTPMDPTP